MDLLNWLVDSPCVRDGRVTIDVRGAWPVAIIGMRAMEIQSREDFYNFIGSNLD